jgi:hypothetical protein
MNEIILIRQDAKQRLLAVLANAVLALMLIARIPDKAIRILIRRRYRETSIYKNAYGGYVCIYIITNKNMFDQYL